MSLRPRVLAVLAAAALALAACSSTSAASDPVRDQSNDVPFKGCDQVQCTGDLDGAAYEIVMPAKWNGTLLIYSHGYRPAQPFPPDFAPVSTAAEPAPGWSGGTKEVGQALLDQGYAIAGSSYKSNGWAVQDAVADNKALYDFFSSNVAKPNRVYVWGDSLGGLITAQTAQTYSDWVNGAAPLCGALAGPVPNFDLALDAAYAVRQYFYPEFKIAGFASYEEAVKEWTAASKAVLEAAKSAQPLAIAKLQAIADIVDLAQQTQRFDGSSITSKVSATVEALATALAFGTVGRYDIEQRYGQISGNEGTDYATRFTDAEKESLDQISGPGTATRLITQLGIGKRVAADPAAVQNAIDNGGNPTGNVQQPTITIHTAADPLVVVQNESFFADRYLKALNGGAGTVQGGLVQLFTVAPSTYPESTGAPFGAGHCNFTKDTRVNVIGLLDNWVRNGVYPAPDAILAALPPESTGYNPAFRPSPWPDPAMVFGTMPGGSGASTGGGSASASPSSS